MNSNVSVLKTWVFIFLCGILWESVIRIYSFHPSWDAERSVLFTAANLSWGLLCAFVFASIHVLILILSTRLARMGEWLRKVLLPAAAVATATFLSVATLYRFDLLPAKKTSPVPAAKIVIVVLLIYAACLVVAKLAAKWNFHRPLKKPILAALLLLPLVFMTVVQFSRNRIAFKNTGSVRHIVLISIDTLRHDYVGAYGAENVKTPVMDRVASEGVRFEVAVAPVPETGPSHATMLTGKSPLGHGCLMNGQRLKNKGSSVAVQLRNAGFQTAGFISGFPLKAMNSALDQGFQTYNDQLAIKDYFHEIYLGRLANGIPFFSRGIYRQAHEVVEPALKWLAANSDRPFFLFLHFYDPHYPYGRKEALRSARHPLMIHASKEDLPNQKKLYAGEVELVDSQIARVIELLKARGIYDQTLLIIVADHGESLGEHNYYYDHERYLYEQLVRVPLIVRSPSLISGPRIIQQQVGVVDIYKTIVAAAGLPAANETEGYDLLQISKQMPQDYNRYLLSHNFAHHVTGIRSEKWKLIETKRPRKVRYELYDLESDSREEVNQYSKQKEIAQELVRKMNGMLQTYGVDPRRNLSLEELTPEQQEGLRSLGYLD